MFIMTKNIINKETLAILKKRKGEGDSYSKLSIEFKIPAATLVYNLNEKYREKKKRNKENTKKENINLKNLLKKRGQREVSYPRIILKTDIEMTQYLERHTLRE